MAILSYLPRNNHGHTIQPSTSKFTFQRTKQKTCRKHTIKKVPSPVREETKPESIDEVKETIFGVVRHGVGNVDRLIKVCHYRSTAVRYQNLLCPYTGNVHQFTVEWPEHTLEIAKLRPIDFQDICDQYVEQSNGRTLYIALEEDKPCL